MYQQLKLRAGKDGRLQFPAVKAYRTIFGRTAPAIARDAMLEVAREVGLEHWQNTLKEWSLRGWDPRNIYGMLEYARKTAPPPLLGRDEGS